MDVDQLIAEIIDREGGFVNDPDDLGGATKYGVTIGTLKRVRGSATVADVKALTKDEAASIYKRDYYEGPRINELPHELRASVMDMYVNAGGNAIKILQRLLGDMGFAVAVDGALGPQSIGATVSAAQEAPDAIADMYGIARRNYYFSIADSRPKNRKYARTKAGGKGGWIKRAEEFISPKYHMTDEQFKARTAAWG